MLVDLLAVLDEDQRGDVSHAVLRYDVVVRVDVALADDDLAVIFFGQLVDD